MGEFQPRHHSEDRSERASRSWDVKRIAAILNAKGKSLDHDVYGRGFQFPMGNQPDRVLVVYPVSKVVQLTAPEFNLTLVGSRLARSSNHEPMIRFIRDSGQQVTILSIEHSGEVTLFSFSAPNVGPGRSEDT